jgi:ketosteroid isomerase-like protein
MSEENVRIIVDIYEAFARRDTEALLSLIDPEFEAYQTPLLPWGGEYKGQQGLMSFATLLAGHVDAQVEPQEFVEAGDRVAVIARTRGRVRANGSEFDVRAVHVWTLKGEKVLRFEAYIDTPGMLRALGATPNTSGQA